MATPAEPGNTAEPLETPKKKQRLSRPEWVKPAAASPNRTTSWSVFLERSIGSLAWGGYKGIADVSHSRDYRGQAPEERAALAREVTHRRATLRATGALVNRVADVPDGSPQPSTPWGLGCSRRPVAVALFEVVVANVVGFVKVRQRCGANSKDVMRAKGSGVRPTSSNVALPWFSLSTFVLDRCVFFGSPSTQGKEFASQPEPSTGRRQALV